MSETPLRHMLLLTVLLFVILSSGSIQCALTCYEHADWQSSCTIQVADCHPLAFSELTSIPASTLCHRSHSNSQTQNERFLISLNGAQPLALFNSHREAPEHHRAEPFTQQYLALNSTIPLESRFLPASQTDKQRRSTILLM